MLTIVYLASKFRFIQTRSRNMFTPSIFDYSPPVKDLPPAPLPSRITKRVKVNGKFVDVAVLRKVKCI